MCQVKSKQINITNHICFVSGKRRSEEKLIIIIIFY